jgi:hypothetical protein
MAVFSWRRWNRILHRDLGYLCAGLTLLYAATGVLLNHKHDWNADKRIERTAFAVAPMADPGLFSNEDASALLAAIGEKESPTGSFRPDPRTVQFFFEGGRRISLDLATGKGEGDLVTPRPAIAFLNALHLNKSSKAWTSLGDLYAIFLAFLALSGIVLLKGPGGLGGRGWWLVLLGVALPAIVLVLSAL